MYFIVNEGRDERRYISNGNTCFFDSIESVKFYTEPQDYQYGEYNIFDTKGFEYEVRYISINNSIDVSRGSEKKSIIESMVVQAFDAYGLNYKSEATIDENLEAAFKTGKIRLHRPPKKKRQVSIVDWLRKARHLVCRLFKG